MATKATLMVDPVTGAISAPITAVTFRSANGLAIGTNVQAWSADLDSFVTNASWSGSTVTFAGGLTLAASQALTLGNSATVTTGSGVFWTIGAFNTVALDGTSTITIGGATVPTISSTNTLTNKTINLSSNTLSGTTAQFNAALSDGDFATLAGSETLTNKVLTAPDINGGTADSLTSLSVRNTGSGAFDLTFAHNGTLAAGRTLTFDVGNAARTITLGGDINTGGSFTTTGGALVLTLSGLTGLTLPTSGTVATLAGSETLTGKTFALGSNTVSGSVSDFNTALTGADFYTTGGTDVAIADGGTNASTAAGARTNLGFGIALKTSDTTRTSTTSPAADGTLQFAAEANGTYEFEAWVVFTVESATPGFKGGISGPASPTRVSIECQIWLDTAVYVFPGRFDGYANTFGNGSSFTNTTSAYIAKFKGTVENGANAGNVTFDWSQWTSSGDDLTVKAGSFMRYQKIN